jgi:RNA polymerase sigma-70 factor (ECF subfamily)
MFFKKQLTDKDLVKGCLANDRVSQEALYKKYFDTAFGVCIKNLKNEADALDIVNEGFLKVFMNMSKYEDKGNLEGWIKRIVYNCMIDYIRKNQKHTRYIELDHVTEHKENPLVNSNLNHEDLMAAVNKLPDTLKEVFKLFAIEGFNHNEIAEKMGINESTSRWYLSEGRKKLKDILNNKYDYQYNVR